MEKIVKKCFICGRENCEGIVINGELVCRDCEAEIVKSSVNDENYDKYKEKIKIILYK